MALYSVISVNFVISSQESAFSLVIKHTDAHTALQRTWLVELEWSCRHEATGASHIFLSRRQSYLCD